jgi:hypothetical protein
MKQCPINKDLDCEECRMNFGPKKCGIFSLAADMSYLIELVKELIALMKKR